MTPRVRQYLYFALFLANAGLVEAERLGMVPPDWTHLAALVSFLAAASMKQFTSLSDTTTPIDPDKTKP